MEDRYQREDALSVLTSLSLLRREDGPAGNILLFHRLLLEVVRDWMGKPSRGRWAGFAVLLADALFPFDADDDPSQWPLCERLMPHVSAMEAHASRIGKPGKALDRLLNQASLYLGARGDREGALALIERSIELVRKTRADEPLELAAALGNLGGRYADLGRIDDAERTHREALRIKEPLLDPNDRSLGLTLTNIGAMDAHRGEYAKVEIPFRRAAEIMKKSCDAKSSEYGIMLSNLGVLYAGWKDHPKPAVRRAQEKRYKSLALTVTRIARGERHPETASRYFSVASMKFMTDGWQQSLLQIERSAAIMLSLDLKHHPNSKSIFSALISLWSRSGRDHEAARIESGNDSDLFLMVAQIEAEHRAWIAKNPVNRHFGLPSPITGATK